MVVRGHRFGRVAAFAAGVVVTAGAFAVPQAVGAVGSSGTAPGGDREAPRLVVDRDWTFVVGGQLDPVHATKTDFCDIDVYHWEIPVRFGWRVSDAGGSGPALSQVEAHGVVLDEYSRMRSKQWTGFDMSAPPCGGGGGVGPSIYPGFTVTAKDGAGNTSSVTGLNFGVVATNQEDGSSTSGGFAMTATRSRGWWTSACECSDAGATWATRARGAKVRYGFSTQDAGQHVGLVMTTGPDRGAVRIDVDGRRVATVDTWAKDRRDRVVVWESALTAGRHTVTLTNLATSRRPRVDVDEVLLTAPHGQ